MTNLLAVMSYPGGNDALARHYPTYLDKGYDWVVGIGTMGGGCIWPDGMWGLDVGSNSYLGNEKLSRRYTDMLDSLNMFKWDYLTVIEYDIILTKALPLPVLDGLHAQRTGGKPWPDFKCNAFYHMPHAANRKSWQAILAACKECLSAGEFEFGSPDCFVGWATEKHGIPVHESWTIYTQNSITTDEQIEEARKVYQVGTISAIHGIKTKEVLEAITNP